MIPGQNNNQVKSKEEISFMKSLASRKFLFAIAVFCIATGLLLYGVIPAEVWGSIATGVVWAYLTGNVAEKTLSNKRW